MLPFDLLFRDIASEESRAITLFHRGERPLGTFLFRELYCTDLGCDCGIVLIHAVSAEQQRIAASFSYSFEPFRDEPQFELDPLNPQSELSGRLFSTFEQCVTEDSAYRSTLRRHYEMWRRVVDDPSHPDHHKLGGRVRGKPAAERGGRAGAKKGRRKNPPPPPQAPNGPKQEAQRELPWGVSTTAEGASKTSATGLQLLARGPKAEGKLQQRFRKLLEKVDRLKLRLVAWRERRADIDSEIALCQSAQRRQNELARRMVLLLDGAHSKLSKPDRRFVSELIEDLAGGLLRDDDAEREDEELKLVYERHTRRAFAEEQAEDAAIMKAMLDSLGVELGEDMDLDTPEKVMASVQEKLASLESERGRARDEPRTKRKRSAKQIASEQRRSVEARDAHKAVQDVYRDLARAVHPDRAPRTRR